MSLKARVAIVTGRGSGVGKDIGLALANEGPSLVLAARNLSRLQEVAKDIRSRGGKATTVQTDISNYEKVKRMTARTVEGFGRIMWFFWRQMIPAL